jgi:hypothetical protein
MTIRTELALAVRKLSELEALLRTSQEARTQASAALQRVFEEAEKGGSAALDPGAFPLTEHRLAHRPGRPPRIDSDPELQAFIAARIDRMTFVQIAEAIAGHFPSSRRVGKSAIHAWWQRNKRRK